MSTLMGRHVQMYSYTQFQSAKSILSHRATTCIYSYNLAIHKSIIEILTPSKASSLLPTKPTSASMVIPQQVDT